MKDIVQETQILKKLKTPRKFWLIPPTLHLKFLNGQFQENIRIDLHQKKLPIETILHGLQKAQMILETSARETLMWDNLLTYKIDVN
jgi:hypothetical protein